MNVLYIPFSQEKRQARHPEAQVLINLREGRKVDVMLTHVKEGLEAILLEGIPRGLCIGPAPEVTCALRQKLKK
jgi:hypothetical protein